MVLICASIFKQAKQPQKGIALDTIIIKKESSRLFLTLFGAVISSTFILISGQLLALTGK